VREHLRSRESRFAAGAFTLASAIAVFARRVTPTAATAPRSPNPAPAPPTATPVPARPPGRTVVIDDALANRLRSGLRLYVETFRSMRKQASVHSETCPTRFVLAATPADELNAFYRLLNEVVLGPPPTTAGEGRP
jgi:hypothetical protein